MKDINRTLAFESNMTRAQHSFFNRTLNNLIQPGSKIRYTHLHEQDEFYSGNKSFGTLRKTIDQKTKNVILIKKLEYSIFQG